MATVSAGRAQPIGDAAATETSTTHPYTCNSCQVAFRNSELQKGHMKSDWHRYNLKRRVASLPPISSEIFTEKVLQARAASTAETDKAGFGRVCDICQKTYYSPNSFQNHIGSAKHKAKEAAAHAKQSKVARDDVASMMSSTFSLGEPTDTKTEPGSDAEEEFSEVIEGLKKTLLHDSNGPQSPVQRPPNPRPSAPGPRKEDHLASDLASERTPSAATPSANAPASSKIASAPSLKCCLFCNYESPNTSLNTTHMERIHGMFIPEKQYLVDLDGLIRTLQERIFELNECLFCGKVKANIFAAQTHMRDTGHCKIPYTTEDEQLEIGDFYDFRSTYSDVTDDSGDDVMTDADPNGGVKLGAPRSAKLLGEDGDEIMGDLNEDGWETDSSESSLDSADLHAVPAEQHYHQYERLDRHPHHSHAADPRSHHQRDGWHSHAHKPVRAAFYDEYELHLPSGRSVGHRSMNRYYRQNLHNHPSPHEREEQRLLAIEAAEQAMNVDSQDSANQEGRRQALIGRGNDGLGMIGVSDQKRRAVRRAEVRGRKVEDAAARKREWAVNKQANHQKYYHYSIL